MYFLVLFVHLTCSSACSSYIHRPASCVTAVPELLRGHSSASVAFFIPTPAAVTPGGIGRGGFDEAPHLPNTGRFFEEGALFSVEPRAADAAPCPAPRDEARRPLLSRSLALSFPGFNERRVAPPRLSPGLSISSM